MTPLEDPGERLRREAREAAANDPTPRRSIDMKLLRTPTRPAKPKPEANGKAHAPPADAKPAWQVIKDYFRTRYQPGFKVGDSIHSGNELREVKRQEACAALPPDLIVPLGEASDAPTYANGMPKGPDAMPGLFRKWAGTAWSGLLAELPDQDTAELGTGASELAAETFKQLVREALLTPITIGQEVAIGPRGTEHLAAKHERRPLADWCQRFAKPGKWRNVRGFKCDCKVIVQPSGELVYMISIQHSLFSQIRADRRLCEMNSNTFARRCARYGVGQSGGRTERPRGESGIVLDRDFVADLLRSTNVEDEPDADDAPKDKLFDPTAGEMPD